MKSYEFVLNPKPKWKKKKVFLRISFELNWYVKISEAKLKPLWEQAKT